MRPVVASFPNVTGVPKSMSTPNPRRLALGATLALFLAMSATGFAAANSTAQAPALIPEPKSGVPTSTSPPAIPAASSPAAPSTQPASVALAPMTGAGIIQMLDQTIDWYRTLGVQQQAADEPSDVLILYDNRQTANQVIGLAFEIARANAEILAKQPRLKEAGPKEAGTDPSSSPTLSQLQDKFAAMGTTVRAEIDADQHLLAKARAQQKNQLQAKIAELQGELDLINARTSLLGTLSTFASESDPNGTGGNALKAQIEAMAVTMPSAANATGIPNNA